MEPVNYWQDYGLDHLQDGLDALFPEYHIQLDQLLTQMWSGDVLGALSGLLEGGMKELAQGFVGMKNVFVWLLILGVISALMSYFIEIFDHHQVADLSFYLMYMLMAAVLLKCYGQAAEVALEVMENILLFIRLLMPTYLLAVGVASGGITVGVSYQVVLWLIYAVENIMMKGLLPLIYSYCLLAVVNGIWPEEKLTLFVELLEKMVGWILKAALGFVTGVSMFQSVITPVLDSAKSGVLQKAISAIPGIGGAADGVLELVLGSAVVIKNSVGVLLLVLLFLLCAVPLARIFLTGILLKCAAALMGIVSDKRMTACANRAGDAGLLLFRTTGTVMMLFLITIAIVAVTTNRGFS